MSSIPSGSLRQNRSMSPWSQLTHPLLRLCYHVSTVHVHGEVAKYRRSKPVCNENVNSLPQSPMQRVPCAVVKLERDCAVVCPQWPVRCDTRIWSTLDKTKWQRTREDPRSLLWCIEAITTWLTRSNGESQDSSREEWIRLKQHNTAASVVQCQQKQMGGWNSCVSKLIGCAASSWQPVSADVLLVTDLDCNRITNSLEREKRCLSE